jgi:hypothetical protein
MALEREDTHPSRMDRDGGRHHGQLPLAEVVPIRPESGSPGPGGRMVSKIAQVIASLRDQATSGDARPGSPSSPDPSPRLRLLSNAVSPDDAA